MTRIKKFKQRADGTVRVVIELPLSFPTPPPSAEQIKLPATVTVDLPDDFLDARLPLISVEKAIVKALHDSLYERLTLITATLNHY